MKEMFRRNLIIRKSHFGQGAGFTLMELLVVMFIISLLSALVLAGYRGGQKKYALAQAEQRLISDLRRAQNMAITGTGIVQGMYFGYGLYVSRNFSRTSYELYGDKDNDNRYDSNESIERVDLPQGIRIRSHTPGWRVDVFFRPPEPITYINQIDTPGRSGRITLEVEDTSFTKTVTITTAGLIQGN